MDGKKLYIEISAGEESYYFTLEEGQKLMAEEFRRIAAEGKEFDGCPYEWEFKWLTKEEFEELSDIPDRPVWLTTTPESSSSPVPEDVIEGLLNDFKFNDLGEYTFTRVEIKTLMQIVAGHAYKGQQGELKMPICGNCQGTFESCDCGEWTPVYESDANQSSQLTIPLSIIEELEKANPYLNSFPKMNQYKEAGYKEAVSKLRELTQSQPVPESVIITTPQAISDVWDAAQHYGEDFNAKYQFDLTAEIYKPDKTTYLKEKFNINISVQC